MFGIDVDRRLSVDILNDLNQELIRARNLFGTVGIIENVKTDQSVLDRGAFGSYNKDTGSVLLRPGMGRPAATVFIKNEPEGQLSTRSPYHGYRHEIGHAILNYFKISAPKRIEVIESIYLEMFARDPGTILLSEGEKQLSIYAGTNYNEMVAEAIAEIMNGNPRELALRILRGLTGGTIDDK